MAEKPDKDDFASAVMMRLIAAGLEKQGLGGLLKPARGAHVPRPSKLAFLERISGENGLRSILALADAVPDMPSEPVVLALTKACDFPDLLERWRRVEVFSHASHRVNSEPSEGPLFRLTHVGKSAGAVPAPEESLLVMGVLVKLGEQACGAALDLQTADGTFLRSAGTWREPRRQDIDGRFQVRVGRVETVKPDTPDADDIDLIARSKTIVAQDLLRRWTVQELAEATGTSPRTLQRRYAQRSTSFSGLIADVRLEAAAANLCAKDGPGLAETGFLAGYSDQAHFSRSFMAGVGTTPRSYRAEFSV